MFVLVEIVLKLEQHQSSNSETHSDRRDNVNKATPGFSDRPCKDKEERGEISDELRSSFSGPASDISELSLEGGYQDEYPSLEQFEFRMSSSTTLPPK
ncbi:hypothetical protein PoB_000758700, partial [Plakobranchus ocellatus]